jgi:hypothetical protein
MASKSDKADRDSQHGFFDGLLPQPFLGVGPKRFSKGMIPNHHTFSWHPPSSIPISAVYV